MSRSRLSVTALAVAWALACPFVGSAQERFPPGGPSHGLYSDAVRVGDLVFLSGVVSADRDPHAQFRNVFERIGRILEDAGSSLDRVVDMTTYHIDMHRYMPAFIQVKNEYLPNLPSWTAVGVTELYSPGVHIEVKVIAAVVEPASESPGG